MRAQPENPGGMTITGLAASLDERLFVPELQARDRDQVFVELAQVLAQSGRARSRDVILQALRERERIWTTAIGRGVAIPHARSLVVPDLAILFARSPAGIDFGADDGQPVRLIFLIVAPYHDRDNRYLPTLGKMVEVVARDENRTRLLEITRFDELLSLLEEQAS
jgi:mannitol/fructose-specific phosphotransferase system IIA component (Ntr-type)